MPRPGEPKSCSACRSVFWSVKNSALCSSCNDDQARTRTRVAHDVQFIGVDGEGVSGYGYEEFYNDDDGTVATRRCETHDYVLLSVGDKSLHLDGARITWREIFPFLWEQYEANPNAAFVGFFLGYDFTHWFRDLRDERAWRLLHKDGIQSRQRVDSDMPRPWPVRCGGWEFDVLANKRFMLRPYVRWEDRPVKVVSHKDGTQTERRESTPWMYVCDAGPFFQSSFLTAINPRDWETPIVTDLEYQTILEGKQHRSDAAFDKTMIRYNTLENDVLSRVMTRVNTGLVADNIRLARQQWFGPGQAAQKWLGLVNCPTGETVRDTVPEYARNAAKDSYYGGWFEIFAHGIVKGLSYGYDINSAYPYGISRLPCLLHGTWTRGDGRLSPLRNNSFRLVNATIKGNNPTVGTMPFRRVDGSIARFSHQTGWYWWDELQAAKRAGIVSSIAVSEWIEYAPCKCPPPLQSIRELYQGRLEVGKNSPEGKGKKLIYNSAYGKLAQSIGQPKFTNSIYASRITSMCRTQILDAIATHPTKTDSLLMVATDSVVFKEQHPTLNINATELGAWDETVHSNLTLFMPGMYWDDVTRDRIKVGESPKLKSRGVPALDLAKWVARIDGMWEDLITRRNIWRWPEVELPVNFAMVTAKQAITRDDWITCGKVTIDGNRKLSADPRTKRQAYHDGAWINQTYGYLETLAYPHDTHPDGSPNLVTTPYSKAFGEIDEIRDLRADEPITPDGEISRLLAHALIP